MKRCILAVFLLVGAGVALQGPQPIPPYPGDDNPQHDGQPMFCVNVDTKEHVHNCACRGMVADDNCREEGGGESSRCKVWCRKSACRCQSDCKTE